MNKLIVIPARGGSKGIPKKNIYPINGKPLLAYTIEVIKEASLTDTDIIVSTDSEDIKNIALKYEGIYVVDRPPEISGDMASTEDALLHAIDYMEKTMDKHYDAVLTLQPTSPLRKSETLKKFIKVYEDNIEQFDALLSLSEDRTDFWVNNEKNTFNRLYNNAPRRRQERKPLYKENSAYYITNIKSLRKTHSVLGTNPNGFVISDIESVDINEPIDLVIAEAFMRKYT